MNKLINKKKSKKGFTLVEMLIVIAIIAILVAIAIPIFNAQLDKAELRVREANARSAASLAYAEYMLDGTTSAGVTWYGEVDSDSNMKIVKTSGAVGSGSKYYTVTITANGADVTATYSGIK